MLSPLSSKSCIHRDIELAFEVFYPSLGADHSHFGLYQVVANPFPPFANDDFPNTASFYPTSNSHRYQGSQYPVQESQAQPSGSNLAIRHGRKGHGC